MASTRRAPESSTDSGARRTPGPFRGVLPRRRGDTPPLPRVPWWVAPLVVVLLTRVADAVMIVHLGRDQLALAVGQGFYLYEPVPADPGYFRVVENWDGQWYRTIAEDGYPGTLPRVDGEVQQNPWAFFPAFPLLVRVLMVLTQLPFGVVAALLSVVCSTVGLVLFHRLVARSGGTFVALVATTALSVSPAASILQTAYSEALGLLLVVLALDAIARRRYGRLTVVALVLSLARPIVPALVPVLAVHAFVRWRSEEGLSRAELRRIVGAGLVTGLSFALWPLVTALVTGEADAYFLTQQAWILTEETGWPSWAYQLVGGYGGSAAVEVAVIVLLVLAITLQPAARLWGLEVRAWVLSYGAYLLVATRPTPSIERYAVLFLALWWPFPSLGRSWPRVARLAVLLAVAAVGLGLQYEWLREHFVLTPERLAYP